MLKLTRQQPARPRAPRGCRAYAVGDIHGRLDLLDELLASIEADVAARPRSRNRLVFLGDLIDRGPHSRQVVERLRTYRSPSLRPIFLLGNHEEVLLRLLGGDLAFMDTWLQYGGAECLASYGVDAEKLRGMPEERVLETLRSAIPAEHVAFLRSFGDTLRFGDYLFVHAGIRPGIDLTQQSQLDLRWIRHQFLDDERDHGFVVVHGHTISPQVDEKPNRIGIDTGAYWTGVLTALAVEGRERWYLDTSKAS
jgi:serine/threonine protein phosphatase 1